MKKIYHIFIIFFILFSLFILKEDIRSVIKSATNYFSKSNQVETIKMVEEQTIEFLGDIETPGALRVVSDLVVNSKNTILLSKSGIISISNKYRQANNVEVELKENQKLNLSAEKKLQDMSLNQYFEHTSPSGKGVADLGDEVGYEYISIGENLAMGNFKDDQALVDAWMGSPGHRANILNAHYTEIGVAVGMVKFEGKDVWMSVQHFGTPRSICPTIDKVLYGTIGLNQANLKTMEADLIKRKEMIENRATYEGKSYFEQIKEYNDLVIIYNQLISETKTKINIYNNQVQVFNLCLSESK